MCSTHSLPGTAATLHRITIALLCCILLPVLKSADPICKPSCSCRDTLLEQ
ncbi:hypothetical protein PF005_g18242 [Phytophthora fragariae]|uniref:RxLR effector protein n=2 Tax=Phytophthora TaxID=4783 RepID=A0A6A3ECC4_9STRA|nr:hypothetical protein PF003_g35566 [Phytophthora fragariae]KAE8979052.1 hypothetical protein PR002_g24526 [Phytophthora rubi]KAE8929957.1 hypothetical protein PF009_g19948 [Phytophthora fragariae]KAE8983194.1 hypothetical protein PR001_g23512 [Phytophthora rubi]KAE8994021.1 hypothetical protein PF011_g16905 [Phytophthora fragariae]